MNGRIYSPKLGRMLSPDPETQAPENGQNYDRYTYAFNNPLRFQDPSGYKSEEDAKAACTGDNCTNNSNASIGFREEVVVTGKRDKKGSIDNQGTTVGSISTMVVPEANPGDWIDTSSGDVQSEEGNESKKRPIDCNKTPGKCVAAELNKPRKPRDGWSFSFGLSGTFFPSVLGGRLSSSYGVDSEGEFCSSSTVCGLAGAGVEGGVDVIFTFSPSNFVEGDNQVNGGVFFSAGPFTVYLLADGSYVVEIGSPGISGGGAICLANIGC